MSRMRFRTGWGIVARAATGCACGLMVFSAACRRSATPETTQAEPRDVNLLLITLDTTRADHLSCYAETARAKTPHLNALAARGARFAHATVQSPLTLPSHACIMTGTYPALHGLRDMGGFALAKEKATIATLAQQAGYATAAFVGSVVLSKRMGFANGFDTYDDDVGSRNEGGQLPGIFPERRASVVTDRALDWLRGHGKERFFLWAHYYDPHAPYDPPDPFLDLYTEDRYSGEIAYTDEQVGRLLNAIEEQGLTSRTLIVVIGDHGESLGEHGELTHGIFLYESTLHVPLIISGPGIPAGKLIDQQVRSIDVMPTALAFLNLAPGPEVQGVNLWPLIQQGRRPSTHYAYLETIYPRRHMGWSELRAMRSDKWKLIVAPRPELYDLEQDPKETTNVINRYPADAERLQKYVWAAGGPKEQKLAAGPLDPESRQELESLGYVSAGIEREIPLGTPAADPKDRLEILRTLEEAEELVTKGQYRRVVELMERSLRRDPANPLVHIYLAAAFNKMGQFGREIAVYEHAFQMKIETDQIYSRLGKAYLRLQKVDKAVEALSRATALNPLDLDALSHLGAAYYRLGRINDAERAFTAVIAQSDRFGAAYDGLGLVAVRRGDAETAQKYFLKALEVDPLQLDPLLNLGMLHQVTGRRQLAIQYYKRFLEMAPKSQYSSMLPGVREALRKLEMGEDATP
ncbi:MAG: sulfatase-like hydrolase/transferase [Acidobacteria bacterium]|nr:sulfatase-like hydrolase/transferase [Acidobacteriota bacterium]